MLHKLLLSQGLTLASMRAGAVGGEKDGEAEETHESGAEAVSDWYYIKQILLTKIN